MKTAKEVNIFSDTSKDRILLNRKQRLMYKFCFKCQIVTILKNVDTKNKSFLKD